MNFWFRGLHLDDAEFFGATTTERGGPTSTEHQLGTCAYIPHGSFHSTTNPGTVDIKVVNDIQETQDGDNNDLNDPSGFMQETQSDGTIWTTIYPPFIKRTQWTDA